MGFRGGGRGGSRGGGNFRGGGGGFRGGPRGGRGGRFQSQNQNPGPLIEIGEYSHICKEQMIVKATQEQNVPKFNRALCLDNNTEIGNVDEIFGLFNAYLFSVKMKEGFLPKSYKKGDKFFMHLYDCLPLQKFLPKPKGQPSERPQGKFSRGGGNSGKSFGGRQQSQQQFAGPKKFDKAKFYASRPQPGNPETGGATKFIHK